MSKRQDNPFSREVGIHNAVRESVQPQTPNPLGQRMPSMRKSLNQIESPRQIIQQSTAEASSLILIPCQCVSQFLARNWQPPQCHEPVAL